MKPAHLSTTAGQIVNEDSNVKTLSDYIKHVVAQETPAPKKLTFDEWWNEYIPLVGQTRGANWSGSGLSKESASLIWHTALVYGKVS